MKMCIYVSIKEAKLVSSNPCRVNYRRNFEAISAYCILEISLINLKDQNKFFLDYNYRQPNHPFVDGRLPLTMSIHVIQTYASECLENLDDNDFSLLRI